LKILVEVNRSVWGKVKDFSHFATVKELCVNSAVEELLEQALIKSGYTLKECGGCKP